MQSEKRIFDDISKVLTGVAGTVAGMGREAEAGFKERAREWVSGLDFVSREEFEAVKQMAATARAEAEELKVRIAKLEATVGGKAASKATVKAAAKPRPAAKTRASKN
jgi:BMFP domain-containing protein YqiC